MGNQNQPEDYVPPVSERLASKSSSPEKPKADHNTQLRRRFAVEQAVDILKSNSPNSLNLGDSVVNIADKIDNFIVNGKSEN